MLYDSNSTLCNLNCGEGAGYAGGIMIVIVHYVI